MCQDSITAQMKDVLLARREAIRSALLGDIGALQQLNLSGTELADFAIGAAQEATTSRMIEAEASEIADIDEALARIADGTFGTCGDCGGHIAPARLEALPYARLCIDCQVKLEKSDRRGWTPRSASAYD